jgi:site-specific DNA-methyltransferase (adenine-specific)
MNSVVHNSDCLEAMRAMPDNAFDLAIVDVPYGIGISFNDNAGGQTASRKWGNPTKKAYKTGDWDADAPSCEYFAELMRVSRNQIIWGANHFIDRMPYGSPAWIVWDKQTNGTLADCELAWTSFKTAIRMASFLWNGFARCEQVERIHIAQKPVALYKWLLQNYAKPGDTILDTHLGSGSSRIAAYDLGFDFVGYELDRDYWTAQEQRFADHIAQPRFTFEPTPVPEQQPMFATV